MKPTTLEKIASLYSVGLRKYLVSIVEYNHITASPLSLIALIFFLSLASALTSSIIYIFFSPGYEAFKFIAAFFVVLIVVHLLSYTLLNLRAEKRGKAIEDVLPDALHLISQSLRGGSPTHQALTTACKTEFKDLNKELRMVSTEVTLGAKLEDALVEMTTRVKSEKLKYVVGLMVFAIKSGGKLSGLLENTATDLRDQSLVDLSVKAEVSKYKIMLMMALVGMVPFLYALVATIITMFSNFGFDIDTSGGMLSTMMMPTKVPITEEYFLKFSIVAIILQIISGSFVIGAISENKATRGLKYVPVMLAVSLILYFLFRIGIKSVLGGMF